MIYDLEKVKKHIEEKGYIVLQPEKSFDTSITLEHKELRANEEGVWLGRILIGKADHYGHTWYLTDYEYSESIHNWITGGGSWTCD